jgi:hypothetical protein
MAAIGSSGNKELAERALPISKLDRSMEAAAD